MKFRLFAALWPLAIAVTVTSAAARPSLSPPDFARPDAVKGSLAAMERYLGQQVDATGDWRARRAQGVCANALQRLEWRWTSKAYDAKAGEAIWRDCHQAYTQVP